MPIPPTLLLFLGAAALATGAAQSGDSRAPVAAAAAAWSYADLADVALTAPVVAEVALRRATPLRPAEAVGVAPGFSRFYVEADVTALIRGTPGMPAAVTYLVDLPNDARGRAARPARRSAWLLFANPVRGRPGALQLVARDAHLAANPALSAQVRELLRESLAPDAPPAIIGIGRAFHVPGALPGTSETQMFLQTARNQPVSLTVSREAGGQPRWFVSLSEFVDAGAGAPRPGTLLWYRLACALPPALPAASLVDAGEYRAAIAADYRLVREGLGPCGRTRRR